MRIYDQWSLTTNLCDKNAKRQKAVNEYEISKTSSIEKKYYVVTRALKGSMSSVRDPCPKFGYLPVKLKFKFLHDRKKSLQQFWMDFQLLNCFSFRLMISIFTSSLQHLETMCFVRDSKIPNLGHVSELRESYTI